MYSADALLDLAVFATLTVLSVQACSCKRTSNFSRMLYTRHAPVQRTCRHHADSGRVIVSHRQGQQRSVRPFQVRSLSRNPVRIQNTFGPATWKH